MGSKSVTKGMDRYPPRDTSHPKPFLQRVINRFLCYASLCAALLYRDQMKPCIICGASFVPKSNRAKYCPDCAITTRRRKEAERQRKRYFNSTHLGG